MLKADFSSGIFKRKRKYGIRNFLFLIQQLEGPFCRGKSRLQRIDHVGSFCEGLPRLVDILEKCLNDAHSHGAVQHGMTGYDRDDNVGQSCEEADQRVDAVSQEPDLPVCLGSLRCSP